jgi:DNA-binding response OmpR family regulator
MLATDVIQATNQGPAAGASAGRILVVDDEQRILNFVARGLRAEGYEVDVAADGERGLRAALDSTHDLIILDLVMPDLGGLAVLHGILQRKPNQAVLVLSCLTDTPTKVEALELGADDYLAKPFSLEELLARVRARLRGVARTSAVRLVTGGLSLDAVRREADRGTGPIALSEREFLLLQQLMRYAGTTLSKERLLSTVWGYHFHPGSNVVDVYIRRLRNKLGADAITTVRGKGYRLESR